MIILESEPFEKMDFEKKKKIILRTENKVLKKKNFED